MKKYSKNALKVLELAETFALSSGNVVESLHLLVSIASQKASYGAEILLRLGFSEATAKSYLIQTSNVQSDSVIVSPTVQKILDYAEIVADRANSEIDTQHILLSISYHKSSAGSKILMRHNIDYATLLSIVEGMAHNNIKEGHTFDFESNDINKKSINKTENSKLNSDDYEKLSNYGFDLTEKAKNGKLEPVIGRNTEIDRIIRILSRKRKNNPIIVGESGVGKTAVVEGLAQRIINGDVPEFLSNKILFSLNVNSIIAGTRYRGEMEEKLNDILRIVEDNGIILFIDELHTVINAGGSEGGLNIGSILKPVISNSDLMVIGATTISEYSKYIEKDTAFERRFMKVTVEEPSIEEAIRILQNIKSNFEKHYKLKIGEDAVTYSVKLSARYLTNRYLPDKAIDVLDEACSKCVIDKNNCGDVGEADIKAVINEMTGIPVQNISESEGQRLLNIEKVLNERIIGQEETISAIAKTIRRSQAGLRERNKPIGSFIFLGTTGVGKTETAKALCEFLFGDESSLLRFDMSEYMEKSSVSRLIGASPGYVGYEEGGTLTEAVKNKPYSLILFDEIEKAHSDVFNVLLQVLDDGRLTDGKGRTVDFRNTIIIMTSNVGTELLNKNKSVGFVEGNSIIDDRNIQINALKGIMRPEFINRIDNIIVFNKLDKERLRIIANNIIKKKKRYLLDEKGIKLEYSDSVVDYIVSKTCDENYGARPIKRNIEKLLEDNLSEEIIRKDLRNTNIYVKIENGNLKISDKT